MRHPVSFCLCLAALLLGAPACNKNEEKKVVTPTPPATPTPTPTPPPAIPGALPPPADVKAAPADAEKTPSGLASKVLEKGTGTEHPVAEDVVEVHYTGWTTDGRMFDSSVVRKTPAKFPLNAVIKGWTEGLQLMVQGEKRRFWIPADLAYGDPPKRPGAPAGMLVFDVELLGIRKAPKPPETPTDLNAPPKGSKKTASGLTYHVLTKGTGKDHPKADSTVEVHYSGWTLDGKMFDSSVVRGEPATFPLNGVIKGWTEGVQLMVVGEKTRFWIPGKLAYGDTARGGAPAGTLVFDVELLSIK
jgi:FKBP-type peptidyl-prolyl cis-trans isomerase